MAISILYITEKAYQWLITQLRKHTLCTIVSTCDVCSEGAGISVFHVTPKLAFFQVLLHFSEDFKVLIFALASGKQHLIYISKAVRNVKNFCCYVKINK